MRSRLLRAASVALLFGAGLIAFTLLPYLRADTGEGLSVRLATWGRDHHLGALVDVAERARYSSPPPAAPADSLPVEEDLATPPPTTAETVYAPAPLQPVVVPALKNEGAWRIAHRNRAGTPDVWTAGYRPSQRAASVTATFMTIDQSHTRAVMFNGPEIPGGTSWKHYRRIPRESTPDAVAAFNGGFRKEHSKGGYMTEGRTIWPLKHGAATLAIDAGGKVHIGVWGRDMGSADGFVSIRQNLWLLVDGHKAVDTSSHFWGAWKDGDLFILRSAVCERTDGKLMYAIVGNADAAILARTLEKAGCERAMQLDVNAAWPKGYVFKNGLPKKVDSRVTGREDLYVNGSSKEFFAFFDTAQETSRG